MMLVYFSFTLQTCLLGKKVTKCTTPFHLLLLGCSNIFVLCKTVEIKGGIHFAEIVSVQAYSLFIFINWQLYAGKVVQRAYQISVKYKLKLRSYVQDYTHSVDRPYIVLRVEP